MVVLWTVAAVAGVAVTAVWSRRLLRDRDHPTTCVLRAVGPATAAAALVGALALLGVYLVTLTLAPWLHWGWLLDASAPHTPLSEGSVGPWQAAALPLAASPALVCWLPAALYREVAGQAQSIGRGPASWALRQGIGPAVLLVVLGSPIALALTVAYCGPVTTAVVWRRLAPAPGHPPRTDAEAPVPAMPDHGTAHPTSAPSPSAPHAHVALAATAVRCLLLWWMVVLAVGIVAGSGR